MYIDKPVSVVAVLPKNEHHSYRIATRKIGPSRAVELRILHRPFHDDNPQPTTNGMVFSIDTIEALCAALREAALQVETANRIEAATAVPIGGGPSNVVHIRDHQDRELTDEECEKIDKEVENAFEGLDTDDDVLEFDPDNLPHLAMVINHTFEKLTWWPVKPTDFWKHLDRSSPAGILEKAREARRVLDELIAAYPHRDARFASKR